MKKNLILLTKSFPFDRGEEFIEAEIGYLSEAFERITIIATACKRSSRITRKIPQNAAAYKLTESSHRAVRYLRNILKGFPLLGRKEVKEEIGRLSGLKKKTASLYMVSRADGIFRKIVKDQALSDRIFAEDTLIYCYWFLDLPIVAAYLKKKMPSPDSCTIISRAHGYDLYEERSPAAYHPFRKYVFEQIRYVFACSGNGARYLKEKYPVFSEKIKTSYLGTADCGSCEKNKSAEFRIATCSALIPLKRLTLLAEALCRMDAQLETKVAWYCIGDGPCRDVLEQMTAGLKNIRVCFSGQLENEKVMQLYKEVTPDLFVNVSSSEGLPVSVMEAISLGIPVMATNVGGTGEIAVDGITGVLLPENISSELLASELLSFMRSGKAFPEARAYWNAHFNAQKNYKQFGEELTHL